MRISLRAGERIYINGAVLRVDRKVSLELLNDVTFLLESHVLLAEQATTPLRQLYFIVQSMLIDPSSAAQAQVLFEQSYALLMASFDNADVRAGLVHAQQLVAAGKVFDALKSIRALYPIEAQILAGRPPRGTGDGEQRQEPVSCN
jgi:flagellar protein FlbT